MAQEHSEPEKLQHWIPDKLPAWFAAVAIFMFFAPLPFMWAEVLVGTLLMGLYLICLLILLGQWIGIVIQVVKTRKDQVFAQYFKQRLCVCGVVFIAAIGLAPTISSSGQDVGRYARIEYSEAKYLAIIKGIEVGYLRPNPTLTDRGTLDGQDFIVAQIQGKRLIAFQLPGGLLDNWSAIVYDPSGVLKPTIGHAISPDFSNLFGGTLVSCDYAYGPWWSCGFT